MALEKAAENNNSFALYWLGVTHFEKMVPSSDPKKAFVYFNKVKVELEASALTHVGVMYAEGIGVPEDMHQAMVLFQKAAKIIEKPIKDKKLAEKIGADNWLRYCCKMAGNELAHHIGKYNLDIGKAPQE